MRSPQSIRPLPVILPPLVDELLSSWINRHAVFVGVSGMRLLRHYGIEVSMLRDLDLKLSRRNGSRLAEVLRCSPHLVRSMTQWRGGRVCSGLMAIRQPTQICRPCALGHAANSITRGARLRSWMEGWRITCPNCGAALEDFRLYTRLFRADPSDALLVRIERTARNGEQIMNRVHARHGDGSTHTALMRSLLFPQALKTRTGQTSATRSRLLELVVPGSDAFFQRLAPEMWPCSSRILPLSVRVPVLAGVAVVSTRPEYWVERLVGAAAAPHRAGLLHWAGRVATSDYRVGMAPKPRAYSHLLPQY